MAVPSIEGTYKLVRRELPGGGVRHPPQARGMLTVTKRHRNFSVVWVDANGKYYSECSVARYKLSEEEYTETQEYLMINDQIGGKDMHYELPPQTASSPVTVEGECVRFALPQPIEKALSIEVAFEGDKMTASSNGAFVDYWEKVP